ncbi:MAG: AMP-binding protein [Deltaproteobacteria bacterium]|nr:AMP-binding protein [Deltaproteobacteria bacterium]
MKENLYAPKPWLNFYKKLGIPETMEPYPEIPLHQLLDDTAREHPDSTAIIYMDGEITFGRLKKETEKLAAALAGLGVRKGETVTILLPTSAQFAISIWGISRTGATQLWASTMLKEMELIDLLNQTGSKTIITLDTNLDMIRVIKARTNLKHVIITALDDYSATERPLGEDIEGVFRFRKLIADHPSVPPRVDIDPKNDCALLRFTGGATGIPKGVMSSHFNLTANTRQIQGMLPIIGAVKGKNLVTIVPLLMFHLGGFTYIYMTALGLTQILLSDNRDYESIVNMMNTYRPFLSALVPAQWMKVSADKRLTHTPLLGLSGAAPLPSDVTREIETERGGVVTDVYGQSEANCLVTANLSIAAKLLPGGDRSLVWVGRTMPMAVKVLPHLIDFAQSRPGRMIVTLLKPIFLPLLKRGVKKKAMSGKKVRGFKEGVGTPLPDTDVKLLDVTTGKEVGIGEPGELFYRGPQLMMGYFPETGSGLTEDGYLGSGDVAIMDEDGFFRIVDRTKDMINVGGFKVYTEVLDEALRRHPSVFLAGCVGVPDPARPGSEIVKAFIQLKEGEVPRPDLEKELTALVEKSLSAYYKPKIYVFLDEIPLSNVDKVNKLALREMTGNHGAGQIPKS